MEKRFREISDPEAIKYELVQSHLIASELHPEAEDIKTAYQDKGWVFFTTWSDLIERAKPSHHQYLEELKKVSREQEPPGEPSV